MNNMGYNDESQFVEEQAPKKRSNKGLSIAALVCGIVGFFFSPFWLVNFAAAICGGLGLGFGISRHESKGMAIAGLVLGIVGAGVQASVDLFFTFTTGFGIICCFF